MSNATQTANVSEQHRTIQGAGGTYIAPVPESFVLTQENGDDLHQENDDDILTD